MILAVSGALLLGCSSGKTTVNGTIEGYSGEYTEFFLPDSTVEGGFRNIEVKVNEDGTFKAVLDLPHSYYDAPLFVDRVMFRTCIEKGKTYTARFNVTDPSVETDFSFTGEGEKENMFTRDWWNGFGIPYYFLGNCGEVTDFSSYKAEIDAQAKEMSAKLDSTGNKGLIEYYRPMILDRVNSYSFYYPYVAAHNGIDGLQDKGYQDYLAQDVCSGMSSAEFEGFFNTVASNIAATYNDIDLLKVIKIAEKTTSDPSRNNFAMTSMFMSFLSMAGQNNIGDAYEYYKTVCKDTAYTSQIEKLFRSASVLVKGADAPEIEFEDQSGKTYTLADLKGKALYVDMWASWCGPCCEEIPYLAKLYRELGPDSDIQCISISIDDNRQNWIDKLAEENAEWPQYLVTEKGQGQVADSYNIHSIPRFMLFDAEGRIITVDAPRPSTPGIQDKLRELLK